MTPFWKNRASGRMLWDIMSSDEFIVKYNCDKSYSSIEYSVFDEILGDSINRSNLALFVIY
jgi:hypothetical protein